MTTGEKEMGNLIGSDKVEGMAVYGAYDRKIGSIERVMIDKISGRVSYAVLGFGGFLGLGNDHYPLPWQSLKYDTRVGGYRTGVTEDQLRQRKMLKTVPERRTMAALLDCLSCCHLENLSWTLSLSRWAAIRPSGMARRACLLN